MPVIKGAIARLISEKQFGFIRRNDPPIEYFFHSSALEGASWRELRAGMPVMFEEAPITVRGPRASRVIVEPSGPAAA